MKARAVCTEFTAITQDPTSELYRKFLGDGSKAKQRSMTDILGGMKKQLDSTQDVNIYDILLMDKKKIMAVQQIALAWRTNGGGESLLFYKSFLEMQNFLSLPPKSEVTWPVVIRKAVFEASLFHMQVLPAWSLSYPPSHTTNRAPSEPIQTMKLIRRNIASNSEGPDLQIRMQLDT